MWCVKLSLACLDLLVSPFVEHVLMPHSLVGVSSRAVLALPDGIQIHILENLDSKDMYIFEKKWKGKREAIVLIGEGVILSLSLASDLEKNNG